MTVLESLDSGRKANVDALAHGARYVRELYSDLFERYAGDVPLGLAYVRVWHETRGRPRATSSQGEKGLLQLFDRDSKAMDVDPYNPAECVWGGMLMWNRRSISLHQSCIRYFGAADPDFWGCSNLTMSIGRGGTIALVKRAGGGLSRIVEWIESEPEAFEATVNGWYRGKPASSSQSAGLVAKRVGSAVAWMQAAAQLSATTTLGFGREIPRAGGIGVVPALAIFIIGSMVL